MSKRRAGQKSTIAHDGEIHLVPIPPCVRHKQFDLVRRRLVLADDASTWRGAERGQRVAAAAAAK